MYDNAAALRGAVEDAWLISEVTETSLKLESRDGELSKVVGLDHIHHFMEDPEGQRTHGTIGTLVLNVQLLVYEGALHAEPVAPPGSPLKAFAPAKPRASLLNAAAKMRSQAELERARKAFAWSTEAVKAADQAFAELPQAFATINQELRDHAQAIEMVIKDKHRGLVLLGAAGWWVSFEWSSRAVNTLTDSYLKVQQWDGHPNYPGFIVFGEATEVWSERYSYGLAALDAPRWIPESNPRLSFGTMDLAQEVLTRLLDQPNVQS